MKIGSSHRNRVKKPTKNSRSELVFSAAQAACYKPKQNPEQIPTLLPINSESEITKSLHPKHGSRCDILFCKWLCWSEVGEKLMCKNSITGP